MNISNLSEFLELSEAESFEKAAENLYTTQSTLSKHIKKMEAELGVTLFDRSSRHVRLSEFGNLFLPYAREILEIEQKYLTALSEYSCHSKDCIRIGSVNMISVYGISDIFVKFQQKYPNYQIDISGGSPYEVYQKLVDEQIDLAFLRYTEKMDVSGFSIIPYTEDEIVVVCSKYHPLSAQKVVSMGELRNEPILLYASKSFMYDFVVDACAHAGFKPNVVLTVHRPENLMELAAQQMGICFLMKEHMASYSNPNVVAIDISPPYKCKIDICYNSQRKLTAASHSFIKFMYQWENTSI